MTDASKRVRRAANDLLKVLREVRACDVCGAEEGCHLKKLDKAEKELREALLAEDHAN